MREKSVQDIANLDHSVCQFQASKSWLFQPEIRYILQNFRIRLYNKLVLLLWRRSVEGEQADRWNQWIRNTTLFSNFTGCSIYWAITLETEFIELICENKDDFDVTKAWRPEEFA